MVARVFARAGEALGLASERAAGQEPAGAIGELIAGCPDFFAADPNYAHANTLPKALGLDPYAPEFPEQHERAVVELLLARTAG